MVKISGKLVMWCAVVFAVLVLASSVGYAKEIKAGYVDLRRAFHEYERAKNLETELNGLRDARQKERTAKIEQITKLRDKAELLNEDARSQKQTEIDILVVKLQEFDRDTRQELLDKNNNMFREVVEEIQGVVGEIGKKEGYDYVFDSRNIMYAKEDFDLTDIVIKQLNSKK
ncbi:MAG: OmpH family outer membrane protein [Candidatus Omnitrophota bacterium]